MAFISKSETYEENITDLVKHILKTENLGTFENISDFDCESNYARWIFWTLDGKKYSVRLWSVDNNPGGGVIFKEYSVSKD
jgi:hypothetical protein